MLLAAAALLPSLLAAGFFALFLPNGHEVEQPPNPNGYNLLVQAAKSVKYGSWDLTNTNLAELASLVTTNELALRLTREALKHEIVVTRWSVGNLPDIADLKRLSFLLKAEGRVFEHQSNHVAAAQSYSDILRVGQGVGRGLLIDSSSALRSKTLAWPLWKKTSRPFASKRVAFSLHKSARLGPAARAICARENSRARFHAPRP